MKKILTTGLLALMLAGCGANADEAQEPEVNIPKYEIAFVTDGTARFGEIVIDVEDANRLSAPELEAVGESAVAEIGPHTETGYIGGILTFRDMQTYREVDALGMWVSSDHAADNAQRASTG